MKKKMVWLFAKTPVVPILAVIVLVIVGLFVPKPMPALAITTSDGILSVENSFIIGLLPNPGTSTVQQITPDIINTPTGIGFGIITEGSSPDTGLAYFSVTNNSGSGAAINITIKGADMIGGDTWILSDNATPGNNIVGFKAGRPSSSLLVGFSPDASFYIVGFANDTSLFYVGVQGEGYTIIVKKNAPYNLLVSGLADGASQKWGLQIFTPTIFSDPVQKQGTITLTATIQ